MAYAVTNVVPIVATELKSNNDWRTVVEDAENIRKIEMQVVDGVR